MGQTTVIRHADRLCLSTLFTFFPVYPPSFFLLVSSSPTCHLLGCTALSVPKPFSVWDTPGLQSCHL